LKDLAELYKKYADWVYRKCLWYTNSPFDAQDLTHDVFSGIVHSYAKFEGRSSEFSWIYRITVNTCITWLRKAYRSRDRFTTCDEDTAGSEENAFDRISRTLDLKKVLASIDDKTRIILILSSVEGLTQDEIADIMKISRRAVCKRLAQLQQTMVSKRTGDL
jgi:RNA polymerase sigma-70 factor (ECF subfamily)